MARSKHTKQGRISSAEWLKRRNVKREVLIELETKQKAFNLAEANKKIKALAEDKKERKMKRGRKMLSLPRVTKK